MKQLRAIFSIIQMMITVGLIILLMMIFRSQKSKRKIRRNWAKLQLTLQGATVEIVGTEDTSADIIMMNHQSIMDITTIEALSSVDPAWVAKKEIADIPLYGNILKVPNMIIVERESKTSLIKLLKDSKNRLDDGRQIAIFPEGTRTDGTKIRKFKAGARMIAEKHNLKVQPIVIVGSLAIWDSKKFTQTPGDIKVIYLDSIEAKKKTTWYEDMETNMRSTLNKELENEKWKS
ncbi:MAG TPA: 1-acyl-sn-glycerol-3-phosphate acyltransferase [Arcobacter sp.]|nr:1-acyl-sn-glycerol-3-phosphate acyltransferase [Arcobacter sp.]